MKLGDAPDVLTVEQAAAVLGVGRGTAYDAVRRGELPSVRIGRCIRVPRHALEQLLNVNNDERRALEPGAVKEPRRPPRHGEV